MDSSVVTVSDAGIPQKHDEIEIENEESSPSAARQEVNKPTDETVDLDKTVEMESVINKSKADLLSTSPKKSLKRNVSFPAESPVTGCLDPPDPWKNGKNPGYIILFSMFRLHFLDWTVIGLSTEMMYPSCVFESSFCDSYFLKTDLRHICYKCLHLKYACMIMKGIQTLFLELLLLGGQKPHSITYKRVIYMIVKVSNFIGCGTKSLS